MTKQPKRLLYADWIKEQAALFSVDGCTGVTNWNAICCLVHDLEFATGKLSAGADRWYVAGAPDPWFRADATTFEACNNRFKACNFRESKAGYLNPFAWIRYGAMKLRKTRAAWDEHRSRDVEAGV